MSRNSLYHYKHQLKDEITIRGIRLWMLRKYLGGKPSECRLSRMLNGIESMPPEIENGIKEILNIWDSLCKPSDEPKNYEIQELLQQNK